VYLPSEVQADEMTNNDGLTSQAIHPMVDVHEFHRAPEQDPRDTFSLCYPSKHALYLNKKRECCHDDAGKDQNIHIGNKIWRHHQPDAAKERDNCFLFFAVNKKAQAY
jgi:hypothetical protein